MKLGASIQYSFLVVFPLYPFQVESKLLGQFTFESVRFLWWVHLCFGEDSFMVPSGWKYTSIYPKDASNPPVTLQHKHSPLLSAFKQYQGKLAWRLPNCGLYPGNMLPFTPTLWQWSHAEADILRWCHLEPDCAVVIGEWCYHIEVLSDSIDSD